MSLIFFMLKDILHDNTALDAAGSCSKLNMLKPQPRIPAMCVYIFSCRRHPWVGACFSLLWYSACFRAASSATTRFPCTAPMFLAMLQLHFCPQTQSVRYLFFCSVSSRNCTTFLMLWLWSQSSCFKDVRVSLVLIDTPSSKMSNIYADSFTSLSIFPTHWMLLVRLTSPGQLPVHVLL